MFLEESVIDSLFLKEVSVLLILKIYLIMLILDLPENLKVDTCRVQHILALGINEYDLLILFCLLSCLEVLIAILL